MAFTLNGVGTTWYGRALPHDDGSYVVTEWFVLCYFPVIPLESRRHWAVPAQGVWWKYDPNYVPENARFRTQKVPLHMPHVIKGYAVTLTALAIAAVVWSWL